MEQSQNIALWKRTSKKGLEYWSGQDSLGRWVSLYKNTNKKSDKSPDYNIVWDDVKTSGDELPQMPTPTKDETNDDVPF